MHFMNASHVDVMPFEREIEDSECTEVFVIMLGTCPYLMRIKSVFGALVHTAGKVRGRISNHCDSGQLGHSCRKNRHSEYFLLIGAVLSFNTCKHSFL
jgi:hypothetical protein